MKTIKLLIYLIAVMGLTVFTPLSQAQSEHGLQVTGAWVRPSIEGNDVSAAYFRVSNFGEASDTLVIVQTDAAQMVELHSMMMDGDVMRMRPLESGIAVASGETVILKPGGLHVMLMGLTHSLNVGDTLLLTLTFESGMVLEVIAGVSDTPIPNEIPADALTAAALEVASKGTYVGQVMNPPILAQDFTLAGTLSDEQRLSDSNGTWRVIFFGYMHCPDFCPLTLVDYKEVKALLSEAAEDVTFVYISVDAVRDTPEALQKYLDHFDPDFVGFSGDDITLKRIQPDYGFYYQRQMEADNLAVYSIDHSTRSYLLDRNGVIRASFAYDTYPSAIADALRWYMAHE